MQFSDEFLERWEHIIDDVDITQVPLECIKKVVIKLHGKRQRTINVALLQRQGLDLDEIETVTKVTETKQVSNSEDIIFLDEIEAVTKVNQTKQVSNSEDIIFLNEIKAVTKVIEAVIQL